MPIPGTLLPDLTDEEQEALFACFQAELGADLNTWKAFFAWAFAGVAAWWNATSEAMRKYLDALVKGMADSALVRAAVIAFLGALIKKAFPKISAADVTLIVGAIVVGILGGLALGTMVDALRTCWNRHFPESAI